MWMCRRDGGVSVNSVIPSMLKNSRLRVWACGWTVPASRFWWRLPVSHFSITFFCSKLMPTHTHTDIQTHPHTDGWYPQMNIHSLSCRVCLGQFFFLLPSYFCSYLIHLSVFFSSSTMCFTRVPDFPHVHRTWCHLSGFFSPTHRSNSNYMCGYICNGYSLVTTALTGLTTADAAVGEINSRRWGHLRVWL